MASSICVRMRVAETRKKNYKAYEENQKNCCSDSIFHMEYIFHQHIKVGRETNG